MRFVEKLSFFFLGVLCAFCRRKKTNVLTFDLCLVRLFSPFFVQDIRCLDESIYESISNHKCFSSSSSSFCHFVLIGGL